MKKKVLAFFLAALLIAYGTSCGKETDSGMKPSDEPTIENSQPTPDTPIKDPTPPTIKPDPNAGISLKKTEHTMEIGDTYTIEAVFTPEYPTDPTSLIYTVSNPAILSVTDKGVITALSAGEATVTIASEGNKYMVAIRITVNEKPIIPEDDAPKPDYTDFCRCQFLSPFFA